MTNEQFIYIVFGIALVVALVFDLGLFSRKNKVITIKQALYQSLFWLGLGIGFSIFLWFKDSHVHALEYLSAYFMEKSLSIDNIFVFILIFSAFNVKEQYYGRTLMIGVLMAIVFRIIFITVGVALLERFHWLLYVFGVFLVYTGYQMFVADEEKQFNPKTSKIYKWIQKVIPLVPHDGNGRFSVNENGKRKYTTLFVVILMLAAIDLLFAVDSIPAVMGISQDRMVIYTSNIFAILGLRSLFFLLRGAVDKFDYLQQGIATVLIFIGAKMLAEKWISQWFDKNTQVLISLGVIVVFIGGSIWYSVYHNKKGTPKKLHDGSIDL